MDQFHGAPIMGIPEQSPYFLDWRRSQASSPYSAPPATAFMGNYPPRASSTTTRQMARLPVHPMFDDPLRWVVPRYNRPKPIAAPPTRYRPQDLYTRRLLETWRAMQRPQAVQTSPHPLEQALGYRPGGNYGIQPSVIASGNANGFVKNPPWWTQLLALAGGPMADAALGLARAAIGNRNAGTLSAIMGDYANQMSQFGDPGPITKLGPGDRVKALLGQGYGEQQGNWLRGGASFGLNSPLKKASLTEYGLLRGAGADELAHQQRSNRLCSVIARRAQGATPETAGSGRPASRICKAWARNRLPSSMVDPYRSVCSAPRRRQAVVDPPPPPRQIHRALGLVRVRLSATGTPEP